MLNLNVKSFGQIIPRFPSETISTILCTEVQIIGIWLLPNKTHKMNVYVP